MIQLRREILQRALVVLSVQAILVVIDQITKYWARNTPDLQVRQSYLWDTFALEHAENPGGFLSFGAALDSPIRMVIFIIAVAIFVVGASVWVIRRTDMDRWYTLAMTLFIAGGVGNLIDRIDHGTVTDFMVMGIGPLRTGVFNIADMAIMTGMGMLLLHQFVVKDTNAKS